MPWGHFIKGNFFKVERGSSLFFTREKTLVYQSFNRSLNWVNNRKLACKKSVWQESLKGFFSPSSNRCCSNQAKSTEMFSHLLSCHNFYYCRYEKKARRKSLYLNPPEEMLKCWHGWSHCNVLWVMKSFSPARGGPPSVKWPPCKYFAVKGLEDQMTRGLLSTWLRWEGSSHILLPFIMGIPVALVITISVEYQRFIWAMCKNLLWLGP